MYGEYAKMLTYIVATGSTDRLVVFWFLHDLLEVHQEVAVVLELTDGHFLCILLPGYYCQSAVKMGTYSKRTFIGYLYSLPTLFKDDASTST